MNIYEGLESFKRLSNAVVTSGTFDGVHIGHQKILDRLYSLSDQIDGETVLITFWPHPRIILDPDYELKLLTTFEEKAKILEKTGLKHLVKIKFTKEFAMTSSTDFIKEILVEKIGTKKLVIGYDHKFGKNREGSFEHLLNYGPNYGFEVEEIPGQEIDEMTVSSTKIRQNLIDGNIHISNQFLGRPYQINATVIDGDKVGRTIGFPTANLKINSPYKLIPSDGTYAVKVTHANKTYGGMLNIGFRPTRNGKSRSIEVHIFDFEKTIYNDSLSIDFLKQIRKEKKFSSLEGLKDQLIKDKSEALKILEFN